ncbi:HWE histidine kinase domain-containing protein [Aureimonas mangrovi]|uniref:HWE histidine kinase domain-containing protein n=1 Tax=Aureimonas mangrovi TaxID=2758041 RepID=UPI00163D78EA|nr:HWE histidine kinase domain-containing protein [Aureimonas mangrovi]
MDTYAILDTPPEDAFEDIVHLAREICHTSTALISLVVDDRQWFKARVGFDACQTPIEQSVCSHALEQTGLLIIPDLTLDPRTQLNSLVTGDPFIRFYAGARLETSDGVAIGTLCVLDNVPRPDGLTTHQAVTLERLARQVMTQMELRRAIRERDAAGEKYRAANLRLENADERLQIALAASGVVGLWDWIVETDLLHGDAHFARLYGLDPDLAAAGLTMEEYQEFVVADDLGRLRERIRDTFENGADFRVEYRLLIPGQALRWVECKGRMIYTRDGKAKRFSGSAIDITARKVSEKETRRLARIVEQSGDFIGVARLDGSVEWVNETGRDLVGLTDASSAERTSIRDYFDPAQWPEIAATVLPAVDRDGHWRGELTFRHFRTGELIPVLYDIIGLRDGGEEVVAYANISRDMRDEKAAEARQHILNEELSHRMKNTLAMVQAVATQTLRGVTEKDAVEAFKKRLHAIASAHHVLLQQNWSAAQFRQVVDAVLANFEMGDRFSLSGENITLGPRATLSLSLLLHELATNALKYGALSNETGHVALAWSINTNGELILRWEESGGPSPQQPDRRGFGSRLISMGLTGTGGSELHYPPEGFKAIFSAPLDQVQQH